MRIIACVISLLVLAQGAPAFAQPPLYRVVNVASHDVLNVRARPTAYSAIIGEFAPGTERVEVLVVDAGWGRVSLGERTGWVNLAYMAPMDRPSAGDFGAYPGQEAPGALSCGGTEPFWGFRVGTDGQAGYYDPYSMGEERALTLTDARAANARPYPFHYRFTGAAEGDLVVDVQQCSDGMSDREYGWRAYLYLSDEDGGARFVEGCCHTEAVAPN